MKKSVNGKIVDIDNIELFEMATEGLALSRQACSSIQETSGVDFEAVSEYIKLYSIFYKSLPFPLYALDSDVKYATIGTYIMKSSISVPKMWTNKGLWVCVDEENGIALNFVNATWGLVKVDSIRENNIDLDIYTGGCGHKELEWALKKLLKNQSTSGYYKEFMGDFITACNNQPLVLKWELGNLLEFGRIPEQMVFKQNVIENLENKTEYTLDIYVAGLRKSKEKQHVWSLVDDDDIEPVMKPKYVKQYGFDVYEKISTYDEDQIKPNGDKIKKCELYGATSIFNTLCSIRNISEKPFFENYKAFICDGNIVYEVNNRVFIAKAYKFIEPKEVARGVELYAYDRGIVYFLKTKKISDGVSKETIYSYSLKDGNLRLCKIQFTR